MEQVFGGDFYFVHFNRQPGVADAVLDDNVERFLRNMYHKNLPPVAPAPGMALINIALAETASSDPIMSDDELAVFLSAFEASGFTSSINWYRNLDRNWELLADVDPIVAVPALMIRSERDTIPKFVRLSEFVPNVDEVELDCGHWIQQELPEETTKIILSWLARQGAESQPCWPSRPCHSVDVLTPLAASARPGFCELATSRAIT